LHHHPTVDETAGPTKPWQGRATGDGVCTLLSVHVGTFFREALVCRLT